MKRSETNSIMCASLAVLVDEVSRVNDDRVDNHFYDAVGRFPDIDEDEDPLYPVILSS